MNPKYRFFLQLNGGGDKIAANPVYNDDMTLDYELESNQRFYRAKLSGQFQFVRNDYFTIMGAAFDTVYYLYIEKSNDWGATWEQYYKAQFMRTDCTINDDDLVVTVQPQPIDQYNDIIAGLEKEYNILSLAPEIERITLQKRPLIQIYIPGESIVSCFLSGMSWEQDCEVVNDTDVDSEGRKLLEYKYHFAPIVNIASITLSVGTPQNTTEQQYLDANPWINEARGQYIGDLRTYKFINPDNGYYIQAENPGQSGRYLLFNADNVQLAATPIFTDPDPTSYGSNFRFEYGYDVEDATYQFAFLFQSVGASVPVMGRYLLDVETIAGLNTYELPVDDMVGNNRNYRRAIGYAVTDVIAVSMNFSDTPTEYGLADNGKYYNPPYSLYGQKFYPIARSRWQNYSIWFAFHFMDESLESQGRKSYILRDNYPVSSILSVLLEKVAPGITHEATPAYSQFLYNLNNPLTGYSFRLFVTPKSNILVGDYQTPVQKAPGTLGQFLDMLRNTFQLYWHIEDNRLRIEHISWYKNGGSYGGNAVIGYDLTQMENTRNGKNWAFGTSKYTFDKEDMPERYQFSWMDEVTEPFAGQPIEVVSKYVQPGKIEEINIGGFTSDVDLMLLNPEQFSQDGFALFAATQGANGWELPFVRRDVDNVTYYLQNGYLAMVNLQPQYWLYDMPARNLVVNGVNVWAYGIQRRKSQTITFPVGDNDPDILELVKTQIGNGEFEKISINLSSRTAEATLKYDTE